MMGWQRWVGHHHHASLLKSSIKQVFCFGAWSGGLANGNGLSRWAAGKAAGLRVQPAENSLLPCGYKSQGRGNPIFTDNFLETRERPEEIVAQG
jgi:hypothetical protein